MRRFIRSIGHNDFCFRKMLRYLVVNLIKGHAVVDISGSYHCLQHKAMLIAGSMRFVRKLPLVLALYEQAAVRVGNALRHSAGLLFLPARQLLLRCVIPALPGRGRWIIVVVEGLLTVRFSVRVDLFHQLFCIVLGRRRDLLLYLLLRIGVRLDVGAVYKDSSRRKISCICYFAQYPRKYLVYRFCVNRCRKL